MRFKSTFTKACVSAFCTLFLSFLNAQSIDILTSGTKTSLRGLSVVDDETIWVSGSAGMVGRSINAGKTWDWFQIPGFEKREFRDIEAFDSEIAVIIAIAEPAAILKTRDGGKTWRQVFEDTAKGMFLDAMDFINDSLGVVIGDPINGKAFLSLTSNGGNTWESFEKATPLKAPILDDGEAFFASSGSNIKLLWNTPLKRYDFFYVTGGKKSRLFIDGVPIDLPLVQGLESTGANSIDITPNYEGIIVGGDFSKDSSDNGNCILFNMKKGVNFTKPNTPPNGYRSSVVYLNRKIVVCCGTTGIDISKDGGKNWKLVSKEGFHVVQKAKMGNAVFMAGRNGRIARFWAK